MDNTSKQQRPANAWPFGVYGGVALCFAVVGLMISIYLAISHYRVYTDISYESFCALTKALNCDTVSQSRYAVFGSIPVAIWGVWGYVFLVVVLMPALRGGPKRLRLWSFVFFITACFSLGSIALAAISTFIIHSYCIMCVATYAVNFGLLYTIWIIIARFNGGRLLSSLKDDLLYLKENKRWSILIAATAILVLGAVHQFIPRYWQLPPPTHTAVLPSGITAEGHPWIGAENPVLVITVFSDYQCFQCRKMHYHLRHLIEKHRDKIQLVHRHYPMDHEFNPIVKEVMHLGSGKLALMAIGAAKTGRFWPVNDILFAMIGQKKQVNYKRVAALAGVSADVFKDAFSDPEIRVHLDRDIIDGIKLKISGTPTFVINDQVFFGQIPPDVISKALLP